MRIISAATMINIFSQIFVDIETLLYRRDENDKRQNCRDYRQVSNHAYVPPFQMCNLGVREARDSPSTPPSHNPAFKIDSNHDSDDLGI